MSFRSTIFGNVYNQLDAVVELNIYLKSFKLSGKRVFFLVDENTHEHCLPLLLQELPDLGEYEVLEVVAGETSKSIDICFQLWSALNELGADRHSLLINVGGGMITDLGGFVASTFKRGISFLNIPTSLLGMVDAAIGGKTGIDVAGVKNMVGTFAASSGVYIVPDFLYSLPERDLYSGFAEMIKHSLISGADKWQILQKNQPADLLKNQDLVRESLSVKLDIVEADPKEVDVRKYLNFGHTLGHAIESYFLESDEDDLLLHGEAVALGMWLELELSSRILGFDSLVKSEVQRYIQNLYNLPILHEATWDKLMGYLKSDKKNKGGEARFVLLESVGTPRADLPVQEGQIQECLNSWNRANA